MKRLTLLLTFLVAPPILAEEQTDWSTSMQIHGFASQGYIHTSDNHFFGNSDSGSFDFTELGINGSFQLSPRIRMAGQLLSRRAGGFDTGAPRVDYALFDISLLTSAKGRIGTYIGRVKNPIGLFNETRDVAHTRQGILLPQTIYFDEIRDLIMSTDGVHVYGDYYFRNSVLLLQAGLGYPLPDKNVEYNFLGRDWAGGLDAGKPGLFGKLLYEYDGGRWIYSLTGTSVTIDFNAGAADTIPFPAGPGLHSGHIDLDYTVLSAQYNGEKWQFTAEATLEDLDFVNISDSFAARGTNAVGFYGQVNYKFTPEWQMFVRYEEFQVDKDDWDGKKAALESIAISQQLLDNFGIDQPPSPAHNRFSKIWSIGGRWDIKPNLMLRAEYQIHDGTVILSPRENDLTATKGNWDLLAISLSYRF